MKKRAYLEPLLKSEAAASEDTPVVEELDAGKAFDAAMTELSEDLSKAKKTEKSEEKAEEKEEKAEEKEEEAEDDEEEDEADDSKTEDKTPPLFPPKKGKKGMKKSLVEDIADQSPEAEAAMDVEPFLKSLAEAVDARLSSIEDSISKLSKTQEAQSKVLVAEGNLLKSALAMDEASLSQPEPRKSVVTTMERFTKSSAGADTQLTDAEARSKLITLAKSNKLSPTQVSIIEGRLNKGMALPEYFYTLINNPA